MQVGTGAGAPPPVKSCAAKIPVGRFFDFKWRALTFKTFNCPAVSISANRSGPQTVAALPISVRDAYLPTIDDCIVLFVAFVKMFELVANVDKPTKMSR